MEEKHTPLLVHCDSGSNYEEIDIY